MARTLSALVNARIEPLAARMSLRTQLGLGFATLVLMAAGVAGYGAIVVGQVRDAGRNTAHRSVPYLTALFDAALAAQAAADYERSFLIAGDPDFAAKATKAAAKEQEALDRARAAAVSYGELDAVTEIETDLAAFNESMKQEFGTYATDRTVALVLANGPTRALRKGYEVAFSNAIVMAKDRVSATAANDEAVASRGRTILLVLLGLILLIGGAVATLLARAVSRPLVRTVAAIEAAADGDLSQRVVPSGNSELRRMANATNRMLSAIGAAMTTIAGSARAIAGNAAELTVTSEQLGTAAETASTRVATALEAANRINDNVRSVAAAGEDMGSTIKEIANSANSAAQVAGGAVMSADAARTTVAKLANSSSQIGSIVEAITSIAGQTNLLALNATIEAARAGESGQGFAVVAGEVKELARETANATEDITRQISTIQGDTHGAINAIDQIGIVIGQMNEYQTTIAAAVEEQSVTTKEMSRAAGDAATSTAQIVEDVASVVTATRETSTQLRETIRVAHALQEVSVELTGLVAGFRY
jgi:methyl-accepting chemotaxis protein